MSTNPPTQRESALHAHVHAVLAKLEEVKTFAIDGLKKIGGFIEKEAPVVEAAAAALASAVPGLGTVAAIVGHAAGEAAAIAAACCGHDVHYWSGNCATPGCSCAAGPKSAQ